MQYKTTPPLNPQIIKKYNNFLSKRTLKADLLRDFFYNLSCIIDPEEKANYEAMIDKAISKAKSAPEDDIQDLLTHHYTFINSIEKLIEEVGGCDDKERSKKLIAEAVDALIMVSGKDDIPVEAVVLEEGTYIIQNIMYVNEIEFSADKSYMKNDISAKLSSEVSNIMIELIDNLSLYFAGIEKPTIDQIQNTITLIIYLTSELQACSER